MLIVLLDNMCVYTWGLYVTDISCKFFKNYVDIVWRHNWHCMQTVQHGHCSWYYSLICVCLRTTVCYWHSLCKLFISVHCSCWYCLLVCACLKTTVYYWYSMETVQQCSLFLLTLFIGTGVCEDVIDNLHWWTVKNIVLVDIVHCCVCLRM